MKTVCSAVEGEKDPDPEVREAAREALKQFKNQAVEPLIGAMKDADEKMRKELGKVLREITGKKYKDNLNQWKDWWERSKPESK
jgi:HEAT repeat protein